MVQTKITDSTAGQLVGHGVVRQALDGIIVSANHFATKAVVIMLVQYLTYPAQYQDMYKIQIEVS